MVADEFVFQLFEMKIQQKQGLKSVLMLLSCVHKCLVRNVDLTKQGLKFF